MRIFATILNLFLVPLAAQAERVALVIGNSDYQAVAELDNPRNDARAVAAALKAQGFDVLTRLNLGRTGLRDSLREFRARADRAEFAVVYYAGHGIEIGGINYLVPVDARLEDERDATLEMIDLDLVLNQISGARQMKMVVLDACRNNPFVIRMRQKGGSRGVGMGLGDVRTTQADTLIAYAAAAGAVTPDGPAGGHSPFTAALLESLQGPPTDVRQLLGRVRDRMRQTVPGAAPFVYSSLGGGSYVINPNGRGPSAETVQSPPAAGQGPSISEEFVRIDRAGTLADWDAFLVMFEDQSSHPLYAFALEKRRALKAQARGGAPVGQAAQETRPPAPSKAVVAPEAQAPVRAPGPIEGDVVSAPAEDKAVTQEQAARQVQTLLVDRGCYFGGIDGQFGRNSARALSNFMSAAGISRPVGQYPPVADLITATDLIRARPGVNCPRVARRSQPALQTGNPASSKSAGKAPAPGGAASDAAQAARDNSGAFKHKDRTRLRPESVADCIGSRKKFYDCD